MRAAKPITHHNVQKETVCYRLLFHLTLNMITFSEKWKEVRKNKRTTTEERKSMRADEVKREQIIKVLFFKSGAPL